jgi:hypothetical protein
MSLAHVTFEPNENAEQRLVLEEGVEKCIP